MFLVVGCSWYAVVAIREPGVLHYFLVEEVVNRVATDKMHRNAEWYGAFKVYLPTVLLGMMPWLPLLLFAGWRRRSGFVARVRANDEARLLACWLLLPLAVFTLSRSRLPLYLLPLFVPLALMAARALAPLDMRRHAAQALLVAWCAAIVIARALPAYLDVPEDDGALAGALRAGLPAAPNEIAFVESDPRYGLRFYLDSKIERLELPGGVPKPQTQDIRSEMQEHEGCRVLLVNDWNLARLEQFLVDAGVAHKRIGDVRGYVAIAQLTPDCGAYASL